MFHIIGTSFFFFFFDRCIIEASLVLHVIWVWTESSLSICLVNKEFSITCYNELSRDENVLSQQPCPLHTLPPSPYKIGEQLPM